MPLAPTVAATIRLSMYPTFVLLRKGHRIRVALAGVDASLFERCPAEETPKLTVYREAQRFPKIWVPNWENRDLRQLLWHRHRMVQARTRIMNQLQAMALNESLRCKKKLRSSSLVLVISGSSSPT